jgi:hypothetical protein
MPKTSQPHPDTSRLNFVAEYVSEINTISVKKGARVEMIWNPVTDETEITTRNGSDVAEAFRKCVNSAMKILAWRNQKPR